VLYIISSSHLYRLYLYYYNLSFYFYYPPHRARFDSRQVRLAGGGYVPPFPLSPLVNPSACVRIGGERSHSYPGTTIGGSGGIRIHALQLVCSGGSEFTRLTISLQQQFLFIEPTHSTYSRGLFYFVTSRLSACVGKITSD
jgi:hypothetical protein